jgi:hypothetical protein
MIEYIVEQVPDARYPVGCAVIKGRELLTFGQFTSHQAAEAWGAIIRERCIKEFMHKGEITDEFLELVTGEHQDEHDAAKLRH